MDSASDRSFVKELREGESAKLLSLDGGGVKGISSLVILQAIMEAVKEKEIKEKVNMSDEERLPRDYFHLAAGTSTGGLIALMLFRLNMSTSDAIVAYQDMASTQLNGRMARPEEIASAALYLAADESAMVTGSALMIDGGWSAGK